MSYSIKFDEISAAQQSTQTTISAWGDGMTSIQTALSALIGDSRLQGQTVSSIKSYLSEVHGTLLQTLQSLMNDYSASLLLYKDGYYQIDSNSHAQLPGQVFKTLQSELRLSQAHLKDQLELLQNARAKVSDLVHYSGVSHAKTVVDYSELITDINRLDEAIMQYESNHASQDLAAFKELLASTKALIAEYSSKPKRAGSYQVGDIGQLNTIKRFATAYQGVARHLETNAKRLQTAQERDQARFEAVAAEDRAGQGWVDLALSLVTIAVGVAAIVMTAGAATPLVVGAFVAGSGTVAYGASNLYEAGHNIYLGSVGDGVTVATNLLRDTLFMGNDRLYHQVGGLFTTASAALIPIGQTKSIAKGLTEFTIGEVGGFIGGQASYHGTKLLGGSEQDAQRATLVGNILGGFAASSVARRFSLNEPIAARVTKPTYSRQQLLKNLESSRLARESSRFKSYVAREKFTTTLAGMSPEDSQRYIQWHKYAKSGLNPSDRARILEISEKAPKIEYQKGISSDDILTMSKKNRPNPEEVYKPSYIKAHRRQFANGAAKFQKFKPNVAYQKGIVGDELGNSFWLSKDHADIIQDVAKGDNRLYETLLGFDEGYLGDGPLYRLDVSPEVISEKGISIPSGNEKSANSWWRPGGRTYPGDMPEGVMKDISTSKGEHTWHVVN
ncbi:T7SS effector LXG polymorphic toxin [Streptococcus equi subsp. zooepidemicus]|uniref:T7SS effector LXG polymorphic toxin n=2 Tax=Streptococcus equi TaxID=1336 RepID=UPI0024A8E1C2|nr:T7SS effector LXG polymorphic toxin [Streptococcus equi]MDI6043316.1 T7SS effector LXG polymorphic toxin [Streptococcus equi subsp. zooepidemicus]